MRAAYVCALLALTAAFLAYPSFVSGGKQDDMARVTILYKDGAKSPQTASGMRVLAQKARAESISDKIQMHGGNITHDFSTIAAVSADVPESAIADLERDPNILAIERSQPVRAFLEESVPLIGANSVWQRTISGINITGEGTSVCVIDTGVDYTHPDLGGAWGNKVIAGYNAITGQDCSTNNSACFDDQSHGTHVAGIIAANGSVKGVAPDAKIVAVKVMNSSGEGTSDDVIKGIDWCTNKSAQYNITVISMSLGGDTSATFCDAADPVTASSINAAIAKNISVVVATGNSANYSGISYPACIQNSTRVGATYDANIGGIGFSACSDASTGADKITCYTDRGANFPDMLLAPGGAIYSTVPGNFYATKHGTSMATPHVSGAIALLSQAYKAIYGGTQAPAYFRDVLNSTGKQIPDPGTQLSFPRINVSAAYLSLIYSAVTIHAPRNGSFLGQNFSEINASQRFSGAMWFSVDSGANITACASCNGFTNSTGNLSDGIHNVTVYANNSLVALNFTEAYFMIDTIYPSPFFTSPTEPNGTFFARGWIAANISVNETNFANLTLRLYRDGVFVNSTVFAEKNSTFVNWTNLPDGAYQYNATVLDFAGNSNTTQTQNIFLSRAPPSIENISVFPPVGYRDQNITVNFSVSGVLLPNAILNISRGNVTWQMNLTKSGAAYSAYFTNTSETGTYGAEIFAYDSLNHTSNASRSFEISEPIRLNISLETNAALTLKIKYGAQEMLSSPANQTENISALLASESYSVEVHDDSGVFSIGLSGVNLSMNTSANISFGLLANITSPYADKFRFTNGNSSFSFSPSLGFTNATVCFNYTNYTAQFADISRITIFKCAGSCPDNLWAALSTSSNSSANLACSTVTSFSYFAFGETLPYCGDGHVDAGETCSSCPTDAGACPPPLGGASIVFIPQKNKTAAVNETNITLPQDTPKKPENNSVNAEKNNTIEISEKTIGECHSSTDYVHGLWIAIAKIFAGYAWEIPKLILKFLFGSAL